VLDDSDDFDDNDDFDAALGESNLNTKEDEFDDDLADDDLVAIVDSNKPKKQSFYEIPEEFEQDDFDDDDFNAIPIDYGDMAAAQQKHQENLERPSSTVKKVAEVVDYANPFDSSSEDDCMVVEEPALPSKLKEVKISQDPVPEGLEDVRFLMEGENLPPSFHVVGCIRALLSKIDQNSDGEFAVLANISDASGTLKVFQPKILKKNMNFRRD
jgi:hypothetical protein